jgi:uncharacterized integral membrane protein (TIGR00698 family)
MEARFMEMSTATKEETQGSARQSCRMEIGRVIPGLVTCVLISLIGLWLGMRFPIIGAPVFAILMGIAIGNILKLSSATKPGISFCSKKVLQLAIIVLGGNLSLSQIWNTGRESLWVMLVSLSVSLLGAWFIGSRMGIGRRLTSLVGVGTGICGGSAIAAIAPIICADDDEIAFSISTIFLFNVVAVLVFPLVGHLIHLKDHGFGLWAGTAINDTSSVVAAGYSYSKAAGDFAAITKMARTTMIIPISLAFALLMRRRSGGGSCDLKKIFPWFILGFVGMATLNTLHLLGPTLPGMAGAAGRYLIVIALAGVGLGANLQKMAKTGPKPILLGLIVWALVAVSSLAMQSVLHQF